MAGAPASCSSEPERGRSTGFEALFTAAEMRAAEEAYPGFPGDGARADGAGGGGCRPRGDARIPARAPLRGRLRWRLERRRRPDCRARPARGGPARRSRRTPSKDATSSSTRSSARASTARRGPTRPQLIERINACGHPDRLRRPALGRRCVDGRGRGRRRERHAHRHVPREQGRAPRRAGSVPRRRDRDRRHRARARADRSRVGRPLPCFDACRYGPRTTRSSPSGVGARRRWRARARPGRPSSRRWPHFAPTPAT